MPEDDFNDLMMHGLAHLKDVDSLMEEVWTNEDDSTEQRALIVAEAQVNATVALAKFVAAMVISR